MNFLRSRSEQLADYLRDCILHGRLVEPLPSTRVWSEKLGVSRDTFTRALLTLRREGLLSIAPRGVRLNRIETDYSKRIGRSQRVVRALYYAGYFPDPYYWLDMVAGLFERLHLNQIQFVVEKCTDARFRAILKEKHRSGELFFLLSVSATHQRLFARSRKPSVLIGEPAPNVSLPFVSIDQAGAIRHATQTLLRHGFSHVNLVIRNITSASGIQLSISTFRSACAEWPRQPVQGKVLFMPLALTPSMATARRFAAQFTGRQGIVVVSPAPVSMIMTALLQRGIAVPDQAEFIALWPTRDAIKVDPPPIHYLDPMNRSVKALTDIAVHYFEAGIVLPIRKRFSVEMVRP